MTASNESSRPRCMLQDDAVTIRVLKGAAQAVPVGVEGRNWLVPSRPHSLDCLLPPLGIGKVEDHEIILGWSTAGAVTPLVGELEVVDSTGMSEHHAIKSLVILERVEHRQPEPLRVKAHDLVKLVRRPCNAHRHAAGH